MYLLASACVFAFHISRNADRIFVQFVLGNFLRNLLTHFYVMHRRVLNLVGLQMLHYILLLTCEYCISITVILYEPQRGFLCTIRA
jgi:hypothetical protein